MENAHISGKKGVNTQNRSQITSTMGNQSMLEQIGGINKTGIPDRLKKKTEDKAGISLDDVKVQYNSPRPASVQAFAYTQGTQVYLAPGQERHLGHELGHVIQQKEGRVKPNKTVGGMPLNDSKVLEREADSYR